jgi:hypothetical protein
MIKKGATRSNCFMVQLLRTVRASIKMDSTEVTAAKMVSTFSIDRIIKKAWGFATSTLITLKLVR